MADTDQNKQQPKKAQVPNPFAQSDAPANIPISGAQPVQSLDASKSDAPANIPTPAPQEQPSQSQKKPAQDNSKKQAAPTKNPTPFADAVLKPKEEPRKNPRLDAQQSQPAPVVPPSASAAPVQPGKSEQVSPAQQSQAPVRAEAEPESTPNLSQPVQSPEVPTPIMPGDEPDPGQVPPLQEVPAGVTGEDLLKSLADSQVSSSQRRTLIYKIVTGVVVVGFLAGITFGAVFVYNRWVQPTLDGSNSQEVAENQNTQAQNTNTQTVEPTQPQTTGDTDGDTLPDTWESENGLNLNDGSDALDDPDFDQLSNRDEFQYGTDPQNPDTDADGFRDGAEVQAGYDPNGEGRLNESNNSQSTPGTDFKSLQGNWIGNLNGTTVFANDLEFKLEDDGEIIGTYNFIRKDNTQVFSRAKGTFTFNEATGQFGSNMTVKGFFEQQSVDYTIALTGQSQGDGKISGTWNVVPTREVPFLSADSGTFSLNK